MEKNRTNLYYKIFAVVSAILLWFYVSSYENPAVEQIYTVPLEIKGLSEDLVLAEENQSVEVRIKGQKTFLDELNSRDILAYADLSQAKVGQQDIAVKIVTPGSTQLVSVTPEILNIKVENIVSKQFPVVVHFKEGSLKEVYEIEAQSLLPAEVVVFGAASKLAEIEEVFVQVELKESTKDYEQVLPVRISNFGGSDLSNDFEILPGNIFLHVPLKNLLPQKVLPVEVKTQGELGDGYAVEWISADPDVIRTPWDMEVSNMTGIETMPILLDDKTKDFSGDIDLVSWREGLQLEKIKYFVKIAEVTNKNFEEIVIEIIGIEDREYELDVAKTNILVTGAEENLNKLQANEIRVYGEINGGQDLKAGEYELELEFDLPKYLTGTLETKTITIILQ